MCPPIQIGTFSDIGWVVSHSYTLYGPLLAGAATVLYEGKPVGTPDASAFWRIVEEYKVKTMLYVWDFPCQCFLFLLRLLLRVRNQLKSTRRVAKPACPGLGQ